MTLTRAKLESLVADLIERTLEPCRKALKGANIGPGDIDEVVLVGGQTRMPKVEEVVTKLFGKEPHKGVNPDEVVAIGAAVQGGVLSGDVKDVVLLDVTPLSLGVETQGGVMTVLIPRNTTIPARKSENFSTATDNQTSVDIHVLQGERPLARDNRTLGRFQLVGIAPAPRGVPQIEVTFDIDANGILSVSAKDVATGKQQQVTITATSGLSKADVERMVREAESHATEDAHRREEIELRNRTDSMAYTVERALPEGKMLTPEEQREIERTITEAREALKGNDMDRIRRASEDLTRASATLDEARSRQPQTADSGAGSSRSGSSSGNGREGEVVDAEFHDVSETGRGTNRE
jgi:molecular chaperone DnaK